MKDPLPLSSTWSMSMDTEPVLMSVPGTNKKFKRKSREPKRLFTSPEPDTMTTFPVDLSDVDSVDEARHVGGPAPLHRQLMMSQEATASTAGLPLGRPDDSVAAAQSAAIDMRIGVNVPGITSKVSQLPASPFSSPEISLWPPSISQPLSNRLKLGLHSTFPLSPPPSHPAFSLEPPLSGSRGCQPSRGHEHMEPQASSPKESPRRRIGMSADGPGRLPEVKAIQQTRRLLANARERTRVHTISAAFEALRKQVPCYSYGQKLSKLAILRIACNYILSLAQLAEQDYSSDHNSLSFSQCVEQCTRTLQAEGRSKKRKVGRLPEEV
ncbi:transcription factor atoh8 [Embiotoca jacksoni]|uniref:transcription factor atoh8 n=1 Tax=Embiotoca jacksoni TaxID=100190 RepID=UPI003704AFDB